MIVSEMYAEAGRLLNDPNNERWSQAVLLNRFNMGQTKVAAYTSINKGVGLRTTVDGQPNYALDTDVMDIIRVYIERSDGSIIRLPGYTLEQLDFHYPNWRQLENGQPLAYWWDAPNQEINLVPAPDASNAITDGLMIWQSHNPEAMDDPNDSPFGTAEIPIQYQTVPYHLAVVHWAVAQCWMDDATPEALAKSKFHRSGLMDRPGQFELEISRILAKFDAPEDISSKIMWKPSGGRLSRYGVDRKANPI